MFLSLQPGVGEKIAMLASPTAKNVLLISSYLTHSTSYFPNSLHFFLVLVVTDADCSMGPRNEIRSPCSSSHAIDEVSML